MELSIKSVNGTRNLKVKKECSTLELKKEIERLCGALPEEQVLHFKDVQLEDDKKLLTSCGIRSECEIHLVINFSEFNVIINYNNQTNQIRVKGNETGDDLKKKIHKILNKPSSEQFLLYKDKPIENDQKLSTYELTEKSVIILLDRVTEEHKKLIVRMGGGESFNIDYVNEIHVGDVLERIKEKCSNKDMEYTILLKGEVLRSNDLFGKPEHSAFQSIVVQPTMNTHKSEFTVIISYWDKTCEISVNRSESVNDLKKKIETHLNKPVLEQTLIYNGTTIEDDQKLSTLGFTEKSVIVLIDKVTEDSIYIQKFIIQLLVLTYDNKTIAIQISKKLKCIELKKKISSKLGISVESLALSFHDVSLEDEKLLEHYGVAEKSVINLSTRLRGG